MERKHSKFSPPEEAVGKKASKPVGATLAEVKDSVNDTGEEAPAEATPKRKAKAKAKAKGEPTVRRSKFKELFPADTLITVLVSENPKKKGSQAAARFEGYAHSATVGQALDNGVKYADIAYDLGRQYIKLG